MRAQNTARTKTWSELELKPAVDKGKEKQGSEPTTASAFRLSRHAYGAASGVARTR